MKQEFTLHDVPENVASKFCFEFKRCIQALSDAGYIIQTPVTFEDHQRIVNPHMLEAARILLNSPKRRRKCV